MRRHLLTFQFLSLFAMGFFTRYIIDKVQEEQARTQQVISKTMEDILTPEDIDSAYLAGFKAGEIRDTTEFQPMSLRIAKRLKKNQ
jgi:hypothetical protein